MTEFPKRYEFKEAETRWRSVWEDSPAFKWDDSLPAELDYVIDTPPPTVSGTLHVGHVYSYTQADIIARYFRMSGRNVLYPIGWDDNGLPTERLVEKIKKVRGGTMAREDFIKLCQEVIPDYEDQFRSLFSRLALSVDWQREYQTVSKESRAISQLSFLDLYEKGLLERRMEPTLWDPADRTAIAQAEVEDKERTGLFNTIAYAVEGADPLHIATTRPEYIGACGGIMIHPDHPRAKELIGKTAITPLYNVRVPIIAEDTVDPDKGTGIVQCCTFGDVMDIQWWRQHKLPLRMVIQQNGRMADELPIGSDEWPSTDVAEAQATVKALAGMKVDVARKTILELLKDKGFIIEQKETQQIIPVAERSGAPLEIIVTPQWFIKTIDYKDELLEKGKEINWHPPYMRQRFESWVEGIKWDWSISRQRHFGVPLPVWYSKRAGEEGKVIVPTPDQLPVDPSVELPEGYSADEVTGEMDVMDTWATSSVSPQLLTRAVSKENGYDREAHHRLFPMAMRPQSHEIIRTWAFYTIVKALHHQQTVPWRDICVSGWCLAEDGSKMSKSKGNIIDPIKLLDDYGTDAVRYWTCTSRLGNDTALSTNTLKQGKRLVTKLWNASKLALMSIEDNELAAISPAADVKAGIITHPLDIWVLGELSATIQRSTAAFAAYEYANALKIIETFFWQAHCDNYLELVKNRARLEGAKPNAEQLSALHTLYHVTRTVLRLFAPALPYLTEEIWQYFATSEEKSQSLHARGNWPKAEDHLESGAGAEIGDAALAVLGATRKVKAALDVSMRAEVTTLIIKAEGDGEPETDFATLLAPVITDLKATTSAEEIVFDTDFGDAPCAPSPDERLSVALIMAPIAEKSA